jgi:hypothetical protein
MVADLNEIAQIPCGMERHRWAARLTRAATLLQQQESRIADLRVALAECGRAVGSLILNSCSDSFLLQVPDEIRLAVAKAAPPAPEPGDMGELVSERLPDLRQNLETVIRSSRAYDGYSTMTPVELADRIIDAVVYWHPSTLLQQLSAPAPPAPVVVPEPVAEWLPGEQPASQSYKLLEPGEVGL